MKRLVAAASISTFLLTLALPATAQETGGQRLFQLAQPATVRIFGDTAGTISYPSPDVNWEEAFATPFVVRLYNRYASGILTDAEFSTQLVSFITNDPLRYFQPTGEGKVVETQTGWSGSGFVATPDGYIVTNAHVGAPTDPELHDMIVNAGLTDAIVDVSSAFVQQWGLQLNDAQVNKLVGAMRSYLAEYGSVDVFGHSMYVAFARTIPGLTVTGKGIPLELIEAGEIIPGKDVAVMKLTHDRELITLPVGDDKTLQVGDPLYAVGFPGAATDNPLIAAESGLEPTFTTGVVSARKQSEGNFEVIQTDASVTYGSSGGPVLNSAGEVIGLATFISLASSGEQAAGFNFVVPMAVVNEFLQRANVTPAEGSLTPIWRQAVDAGQRHHYTTQLEHLRRINELSPGLPYVEDMMAAANTAIAEGRDETPSTPVMLYAAIALLVLGAAGAFFVIKRRKQVAPAGSVPAVGSGVSWSTPTSTEPPIHPPTVEIPDIVPPVTYEAPVDVEATGPEVRDPVFASASPAVTPAAAPAVVSADATTTTIDVLVARIRLEPLMLATDATGSAAILACCLDETSSPIERMAFESLGRHAVIARGGSMVREIDGAFVAAFASADDALASAMAFGLEAANLAAAGTPMKVRKVVHRCVPGLSHQDECAIAVRALRAGDDGEIIVTGAAKVAITSRYPGERPEPIHLDGTDADLDIWHVPMVSPGRADG